MSDEERIERLLRLADPGPEMPANGEARIKEAVRPLWRHEVRRRSLRRALLGTSLAAAAAAVFVFILIARRIPEPAVSPVPVARVELVRGPVDETLRGTTLVAGARVQTLSANRAALRVSNGASLRLDRDTTVRLVSAHLFELERGAIYIDSGGPHVTPIEVRTPLASVRDIGTQFELRLEDHLLVRVREGRVDVTTRAHRFPVNAGSESKINSDGSQQTGSINRGGENWTAAVAPPFAIEGQSVAALLEWCSRESGFALRYRDRDAEQLARTTLLHGSANDLAPLEAAEMILPTAGLEAIRGKEELIIQVAQPVR